MNPHYDWIQIFAPALPTSIVAIVGFFAYHALAARRQSRDETYKDVTKLIDEINGLISTGEKAWRLSGAEAVKSGAISNVRFQLTQINLIADHLRERDSRFDSLHRPLLDLKRNLDERFDERGQPAENIADLQRPAMMSCSEHAYASANMLKNQVYRVFATIYR